MKVCYIGIFIATLLSFSAEAQSKLWNKQKWLTIELKTPIIIRDTLSILPSSISIYTKQKHVLSPTDYRVENNVVTLRQNSFKQYFGDSLWISYSVLSYNLGRSFYFLDSTALAMTDDVIKTGFDYELAKRENSIIDSKELEYDGSYSRGFSIGNKQSLIMNSNFNLQMSGKIGGDIEITASLSDANIPVQAEGNTQQLNEFDKVFIRLQKDQHKLEAGDLELKNPNVYFSRYHKKLKGIRYADLISTGNSGKLSTSGSYAISKGKFARNELEIQEGNQGPYKLVGTGGERFLIILSGTEKVYIDGLLLKRGREFDYFIDYNLAEISFTVYRLLTKDSRVIVEFEYVDQNYLRSLQNFQANWEFDRSEFYFSFYNEQDSRNAIGNIKLDSADIKILKNIGDNLQNANRSGIRPLESDQNQQELVLYKKIFLSELNDSILVYTTSADSAKYSVFFSDVGELNGSYNIAENTTINGRVYKWIGQGLGRYEPIVKLVAPERKQLYTMGTQLKLGGKTTLQTEISLSNTDINRFSPIDNADNTGVAALFRFSSSKDFAYKKNENKTAKNKIGVKRIARLKTALKYEFTDINFTALNPYRDTEFTRDWNLSIQDSKSPEHLLVASTSLHIKNLDIAYTLSGFFKPSFFSGQKHNPHLSLSYKGLKIMAGTNYLKTSGPGEESSFNRPAINISQKLVFLKDSEIGFQFNREKNKIIRTDSDSLDLSSFYFDYYKLFFNSPKKNKLQFFISQRLDYFPTQKSFVKNTTGTDFGIQGNLNTKKHAKLSYNFSFRQLKIEHQSPNGSKIPVTTLLGRIIHNFNFYNGFLKGNTQFELNSGQEAKAEYEFIELSNPGEGNYIWIDDNSDGIKQKGEFELAPFSDNANFIKLIQYNSEFVRINKSIFNHSISIKPAKIIRGDNKSFWAKQLSKLSLLGVVRINQKTNEQTAQGFRFPFVTNLQDSSLVAYNAFTNASLYYNRANPIFDIQLGTRYSNNKNLQLDGLIQYSQSGHSFKSRYTFRRYIDYVLKAIIGSKSYFAELYPNKNYTFNFDELEQEVRIRFNKKTGAVLAYTMLSKTNKTGKKEKLRAHDFGGKLTIRNLNKMNFSFGFSYIKVAYTGLENTSIELAMLEGLKNGNNFLWQSNITRKMSDNIELSFRYEGRKTGTAKTVHIVRMQAKARF